MEEKRTAALAAERVLSSAVGPWSATMMAVFQPEEETAAGARAMVEGTLLAATGVWPATSGGNPA